VQKVLTADRDMKRIMRIKDGDNQLYVAALLDLLRRYQVSRIFLLSLLALPVQKYQY
jgi:hypothetical protein